jgi:hypothetical protein
MHAEHPGGDADQIEIVHGNPCFDPSIDIDTMCVNLVPGILAGRV